MTVIGADQENPHDLISINGASAALMISGIPFEGPIGAVRLAYSQDGTWIPHPTYEEGDAATFELVVAGRELDSGDVAVMMVEAGGTEKSFSYFEAGAPKVTEDVVADGLEASKVWIKESIALQRQLVAEVIERDGPIEPMAFTPVLDYGDDVWEAVERLATPKLATAVTISGKAERNAATDAVKVDVVSELAGSPDAPGAFAGREKEIKEAVRSLTKKLVRKRIIDDGVRIDGRGITDLRPVSAEVGVLPTAHGSGLFQRGETQVLNVCTLAMPRMNQLMDTLSPETTKRYMHHYNMAPWANGEVGRVGSPKRREIGHGALAARAVLPVVPSQEEFAYSLRLVSEVLSSNGSTSMASVCSSSLSLMDAGVPVKAAVAGIAMGLIYENGTYTTLTDILGAEDAFGDMDFKVAGTADVVTALQLDTKIEGIPADVLKAALGQAREARLQILEVMNATISEARPEVGETAPKIASFQIPIDRIGEVIGPKGKVINLIQQETGADIAVDDDGTVGTVTIGSPDGRKVEAAKERIMLIIDPPTANVGEIYTGKVVNITKFGAFVNILPGRDGLVHISKLGRGKRINRVEDVVDLGDEIVVRVDEIDDRGKVSLSPVGDDSERRAARVVRPYDRSGSAAVGRAVVRLRRIGPGRLRGQLRGGFRRRGPRGVRRSRARDRHGLVRRRRPSRRRAPPAAPLSAQPVTHVTQLPSGLRVVTERVPTALSVAAGVWVGVGARDEPDELSGVSHFLEHLLFKGTEERSARAIAAAVDRVGGDMNAFTAKEYTAYYCRVPAAELPSRPRAARRRADRSGVAGRGRRQRAPGHPRGAGHGRRPARGRRPPPAGRSHVSRATRSAGRPRGRWPRWRPSRRTTSARSSASGTGRRRWWWPWPAPRPRPGGGRGRTALPGGRAGRAPQAGGARRASRRHWWSTGAAPSRSSSRSASGAFPAATPTARRSTSSTTCSAAVRRAGCSRRSASSGGWPTPSAPARRRTPTPVHSSISAGTAPAQVGEVLNLIDTEVAALLTDGMTGDELRDGHRVPHGSVRDGPGGQRQPDGPPGRAADDHRRRPPGRASSSNAGGPSPPADVARVTERVLDQPRSLAVVGPVSEAAAAPRSVAAGPRLPSIRAMAAQEEHAALAGDQPPRPRHRRHGRDRPLLPRRARRPAGGDHRYPRVPPLLLRRRARRTRWPSSSTRARPCTASPSLRACPTPERPSSTTCRSTCPTSRRWSRCRPA